MSLQDALDRLEQIKAIIVQHMTDQAAAPAARTDNAASLIKRDLKIEDVDPLIRERLLQVGDDLKTHHGKIKISKLREQLMMYFDQKHPRQRYADISALILALRSFAAAEGGSIALTFQEAKKLVVASE
jgi:hypothetical protein